MFSLKILFVSVNLWKILFLIERIIYVTKCWGCFRFIYAVAILLVVQFFIIFMQIRIREKRNGLWSRFLRGSTSENPILNILKYWKGWKLYPSCISRLKCKYMPKIKNVYFFFGTFYSVRLTREILSYPIN